MGIWLYLLALVILHCVHLLDPEGKSSQ